MPSLSHSTHLRALALSLLLLRATARVVWIPEEFSPDNSAHLLSTRATNTCSKDSSLLQCPSDFPSNFCCPTGTSCLFINTGNSSVTSAICCPAGRDCTTINPVSCNEKLQDADDSPSSWLHSIPPQSLAPCGSECCPDGFTCSNNQCFAEAALSTTVPSNPSSTTNGGQTSTASTASPTSTAADNVPSNGTTGNSSSASFNVKSFVAGFLPGIAIGVIAVALVIFLCFAKRRGRPRTRNEKHRDTLTDLSPARPTTHGRSISEPTVDQAFVTRSDFLRGSPSRMINSSDSEERPYKVEATGPKTPPAPPSRTPRVKALFSRSPFLNQPPSTPPMTQAPMPAHLKRGTLNFTISPIRALKKQKSMHSLRRQMNESSSRHGRGESTETIQVLMPTNQHYTPDQRNAPTDSPVLDETTYPDPPPTARTWESSLLTPSIRPQEEQRNKIEPRVPYASSSRYPSEAPQLRIPSPPPPLPGQNANFLDSPYTPTRAAGGGGGGLAVPAGPRPDLRRETTFSTLMEKAGLRKSELVMGTKKRIDGRFGV